ncbi:MAG: thiamine ABC transporter ATP-binding protein [Rhizobiaceae bacterium]
MSGERVELDRVEFAWQSQTFRFSLTVEAGQIMAIIGPSGSGKSTLLDMVAGFIVPASGFVRIGGQDMAGLEPEERPVSMMFQDNNLFSHLSVADNAGLALSSSLKLDAGQREAVREALARTGLEGKEARLPYELSGGERQRAALARTLLMDRPVLLLDEPFASLGPALRAEMLALVTALHAERRMTILLVTHQPEDARMLSDRIALVVDGQVDSVGTPEEMLDGSKGGRIADYLGRTS